jgi:hypothetical protein
MLETPNRDMDYNPEDIIGLAEVSEKTIAE